ncbi:hypothetical protein [Poritiphilus flavus]|uniref:Uncharacterized protein n=1 Tax=Poritiphilus flavus TaxID=2697053 RepID=A0A6L9E762_9FLAO|nr:hypothetical protein [Poritiphilus flavus]NAS10520.1 hypothetical protein [Poritiphilus flavus]
MKNSKLYYLIFTLVFLGACTTDPDVNEDASITDESLTVVSARGVTCDNALNGPSSVQANSTRSYSVTPISPTTNPSSIQWSTDTPTMTIASGQGTTNVSVSFSSSFNGGNLTVSINGGVCQTIKYISKNGICTDDCGDNFGGSYGVTSSYYIYPAESFDVSCVANGNNLRMFVSPATVPNRFTIKNSSGSVVASSGWIGTANYPGPWGFSLSSGATNLNFTKTSNTYTLTVETATPPNQTDSWSASLTCQ